MNDDPLTEFVSKYVLFAQRALEIQKSLKTQKKSFTDIATLLLNSYLYPQHLLKDEDILKYSLELFSFDLPGLNKESPTEPQSTSLARLFGRDLDFENDKNLFLDRLLDPLRFLDKQESPNVEELRTHLEPYVMCWIRDVQPYRIIIPVLGLQTEIEKLPLKSFSLHKRSSLQRSLNVLPKHEVESVETFLFKEVEFLGAGAGDSWWSIPDELEEILTALRLAVPDFVDPHLAGFGLGSMFLISNLAQTKSVFRSELPQSVRFPSDEMSKLLKKTPRIIVDDNHSTMLVSYFEDKSDCLEELKFAIRRFNIAYSRETHEDCLIDLVISLESALLYGKTGELNHRLGLRAAILLMPFETPKKTYALIKVAYEIRSKIMHAGKPYFDCIDKHSAVLKIFSVESGNFIKELRNVTRLVLTQLISEIHTERQSGPSGKKKFVEKICEDLDLRILEGLTNQNKLERLE